MSVFNVSQTESTASLNAVERNTSGDRLNENLPNTNVFGQPMVTLTNRNNGINNNSVSVNIGSGGGIVVNNTIGSGDGGKPGSGISSSVSGGGFQSDLCSDSEEDCERTAKKLAVNKWLTNFEDVSIGNDDDDKICGTK